MLAEKVKNLPDQPGVYQYLDDHGRLLYVGKAKSLKKRVKSYFRFTPVLAPAPRQGPRITKMLCEAVDLQYILTGSENDALILENSLIKQLKPKYNILLRDDKTYPYIYLDMADPFPRPDITRRIVKGSRIRYFGPFATGGRDILNAIYELFPLVQKGSCAKGNKACLFHQIGKCLAPCEGKVTTEAYGKILEEAIGLINDKKKIVALLKQKMAWYAENLHFEEAAKIRDQVEGIENASVLSEMDLANTENFDVIAIGGKEERACSVRLFIREGKVVSSAHAFFRFSQGFDGDEAYVRAFLEFYTQDLPLTSTTVYVAADFPERETVEELLAERTGRKFKIAVPQRGPKKKVVDVALKNAEELLNMQEKREGTEREVKELFKLESIPRRIEVFDNSHLMGQATVGAMVVWEEGRFDKKQYRHYNLEAKDEYGQMREMLTRRVESFADNPPPDLWVIDGGETLRKLAEAILESVGVAIDVLAVAKEKLDAKAHRAKGAAKDLVHGRDEVWNLATSDKRLQFLQRLRDEAHRFAITFHRKQKAKKDKAVGLLSVSGVGEARVKRLLDYFGSFEAIENASFQDLSDVVGSKVAEKVVEYGKGNQ